VSREAFLLSAAIGFGLIAGQAVADTPAANASSDGAAAVTPGVITGQVIPGGTVYADVTGKTLYTFDRDTKPGKSACIDACAQDWKPVAAAWLAKPAGDWTVIARDDGGRQWAFKGKPLYTFSGDHKAGDTNGDGAGGAWHAVFTSRKFLPPNVAIWHSDFGPAFATTDGKTLYVLAQLVFNPLGTKRHTGPNIGLTDCTGDCTKTWIPYTAPADATGAEDWSVVTRDDGTHQWAYKSWPVYTNAQDAKAGDTFGEGVSSLKTGISGLSWQVATLLQ
jgi:predicted lipoprotein with Yx(FWY)xxD motif